MGKQGRIHSTRRSRGQVEKIKPCTLLQGEKLPSESWQLSQLPVFSGYRSSLGG